MGAALNDLAYAVNDTIKDPAKFKALNVLMQEMINSMVLQANNRAHFSEIGEILEKGDEEDKTVVDGPKK